MSYFLFHASVMMKLLHAVYFLLLASLTSSQTTKCKPEENCKPPNCRCWNDEAIPGNIPEQDTPQVVLVTFEYAINGANVDLYTSLFKGKEVVFSV